MITTDQHGDPFITVPEEEMVVIGALPDFGDYLADVLANRDKGSATSGTRPAEDIEASRQRNYLLAEGFASLLCRFGKEEPMIDLTPRMAFLPQIRLLNDIQTYTVVRPNPIPIQIGNDVRSIQLKLFEEKVPVGYRYHPTRLALQWVLPSKNLYEELTYLNLLTISNGFHYPLAYESFGLNGALTEKEFQMFQRLLGVIEASLLLKAQE